jgi:farnesyl diphosphate synthase
MQRTFAIIKPDAQPKAVAIKADIIAAGFAIVEEKTVRMTHSQAQLFYEEHKTKEFFQPLCEFMTSGPCTVMVLEKADAIAQWRVTLGPTDSTQAQSGTIRAKYGTDGRRNACHGSDSSASAEREISIFFPSYPNPANSPPSKRSKSDGAVALPPASTSSTGGKMNRDEFLSHFSELSKLIVDEVRTFGMPAFIIDYLVRVLDYNVPGGKLTRGMAVPSCLQAIVGASITDQAKKQAIVVGWCIELLQACFLVADDMMDKSETRRGQPCWYKVPDVEHKAINDTLILESGIYILLKHFCSGHARYLDLVHLFQRVALQTQMGQCLDLTMEQSQHAGINLALYTHELYIKTVVYKTAYYSFYLSVAAGMMLADVQDAQAFKDAEDICVDMGTYFQVQDDYLDCYAPPEVLGKIGTDIKDAKCCWLVIQVLAAVLSSPTYVPSTLLPACPLSATVRLNFVIAPSASPPVFTGSQRRHSSPASNPSRSDACWGLLG